MNFYNLFFRLLILRFRGKIQHHGRRDWVEKDSALYQLMDVRMNGVMNGIVSSDGNIRRSSVGLTYIPAVWNKWSCRKKSGC